jgi:hypothetical protein
MVSIDITKEYTKCVNNPQYSIENYFKIWNNVVGDYVPFKLLSNQKLVIDGYETNKLNIVKKYRQAGISSISEAYLSHKVAFSDPDNPELIMLVSNRLDFGKHMLAKMKNFLLTLPRWVWGSEYYGSEENESKSIFIVDNQVEAVLPNGSRIKVTSSRPDAFRGWAPTYILMDEAAFINKNDEIFMATYASLAVGGRLMMVSTPNGMDRLFHKTFMGVVCGQNNFNLIELNWWDDERFNKDLKWVIEIDGKIIDTLIGVLPEYYDKVILAGYKPTNEWYEKMRIMLSYNEKQLQQEMGGFVI